MACVLRLLSAMGGALALYTGFSILSAFYWAIDAFRARHAAYVARGGDGGAKKMEAANAVVVRSGGRPGDASWYK